MVPVLLPVLQEESERHEAVRGQASHMALPPDVVYPLHDKNGQDVRLHHWESQGHASSYPEPYPVAPPYCDGCTVPPADLLREVIPFHPYSHQYRAVARPAHGLTAHPTMFRRSVGLDHCWTCRPKQDH